MIQESANKTKLETEDEKQQAMSFLRERFLYLLSNLCVTGMGQCNVKMYENTSVACQVKAFDANFENIIVENLVTPIPVNINKAILRTNDIISIEFDCDYNALINKF